MFGVGANKEVNNHPSTEKVPRKRGRASDDDNGDEGKDDGDKGDDGDNSSKAKQQRAPSAVASGPSA